MELNDLLLAMLQPGKEISEAIFDFYVFWLKRHAKKEIREQFYICNTSFFALAMRKVVKKPSEDTQTWSTSFAEKRKLIKCVQKDPIFMDRDWFIMPVCVEHHFFLAAVRNLRGAFQEQTQSSATSNPIFIFDSLHAKINGTHQDAAFVIRNFLTDVLLGANTAHTPPTDKQMPLTIVKVPQQPTGSNDCGPYALHTISQLLAHKDTHTMDVQMLTTLLDKTSSPSAERQLIRTALEQSKELDTSARLATSFADSELQKLGFPADFQFEAARVIIRVVNLANEKKEEERKKTKKLEEKEKEQEITEKLDILGMMRLLLHLKDLSVVQECLVLTAATRAFVECVRETRARFTLPVRLCECCSNFHNSR